MRWLRFLLNAKGSKPPGEEDALSARPDPTAQSDLRSSGIEINLHTSHTAFGFGKLMPLAQTRLDEAIENMSKEQQNDRDLKQSYRAKITRGKLIVYRSDSGRANFELNLFMSKVTGSQRRNDCTPFFALAEGRMEDASCRTWGEWWLFTVPSDSALLSLIEQLLTFGAVLAGVMELPTRLNQIAKDRRCSMYLGAAVEVAPIKGRCWCDAKVAETPSLGDRSDSQHKDKPNSKSAKSFSSPRFPTGAPENSDPEGRSPAGTPEDLDQAGDEGFNDSSPPKNVAAPLLPDGAEEQSGVVMKFCRTDLFQEQRPPGSPLSLATVDNEQLVQLATELKIWTLLQGHKHVVRLIGFAQMPSPRSLETGFVFMMEYCMGGSLKDYIGRQGHMAEPEAACMMHGLLSALASLHERGVLHRNVSPEHLLLRQGTREWVLCGFGVACWEADAKNTGEDVGTIGFTAPEVLQAKQWSLAADAFSAGCVLYFAHMKKNPFGSDRRRAGMTKSRTCAGHLDFQTKSGREVTEGYVACVRELLQASPRDRPTCMQSRNNVWFQACGLDLPAQAASAATVGEPGNEGFRNRWSCACRLFCLPKRTLNLRSGSSRVTNAHSSESMFSVGPAQRSATE
eukprot:TRINITY_DN4821_c0_g1_i1.p1 TRINITY_DN4821_c0_g1~~TRINITY_DN4821_c0_g1_i1.p1  ORF type:complete len:624 (-),score=95.65 TRINITY_DN4821_c0_g1_i1:433-2304(-)